MARPRTAARRYAEAAFELAGRDGTHERWLADLGLAAQVVADESLMRVLDNPAVALAQREAVLEQLLGGRLARQAFNLVRLLAQRSNLGLLAGIAAEYQRLWNEQEHIVSAIVTSAIPLTPQEDAAVRDRVATLTGARVVVQAVIDPALIGGITVKIGDRLIDASVRGRLERMRERLLAQSR